MAAKVEVPELSRAQMALVQDRVRELRIKALVNLLLAFAAAMYFAVMILLLVLLYKEGGHEHSHQHQDDGDHGHEEHSHEAAHEEGLMPEQTFHNIEFWTQFAFNIMDIAALTFSVRNVGSKFWSPKLQNFVFFMQICSSFLAAVIVTVSVEHYIVPAHELEYCNELILSFVDLLLVAALTHQARKTGGSSFLRNVLAPLGMVALAVSVAVVQLAIYNLSGWTDGMPDGEVKAHTFEFSFGLVSGAVLFWFTMDNRLLAEREIKEQLRLLGDREETVAAECAGNKETA